MFGAGFPLFARATYRGFDVRWASRLLACMFVPIAILLYNVAIASARLAGVHAMPLNSADDLPIRFASILDSLEGNIRSTLTKSISPSHFDAKERKEDGNDSRILPPRNV